MLLYLLGVVASNCRISLFEIDVDRYRLNKVQWIVLVERQCEASLCIKLGSCEMFLNRFRIVRARSYINPWIP